MERYFAPFVCLAFLLSVFAGGFGATSAAADYKRRSVERAMPKSETAKEAAVEKYRRSSPSATERRPKNRPPPSNADLRNKSGETVPKIKLEQYRPPGRRQTRSYVPPPPRPKVVLPKTGEQSLPGTESYVGGGSRLRPLQGQAPVQQAPSQTEDEDPWLAKADTQPFEQGKIEVSGNFIVSYPEILDYAGLGNKEAAAITTEDISRAVKNLYGTDYFSDINIYKQGDSVFIEVKENPMINRIAFEGNDKVGDETLENEIGIRPRRIYSQDAVLAATKRILNIYRRSGRFSAVVEPKLIKLPNNRVDLVFEIQEKNLTKVATINFIGNKHFDASELREVILSREKRWYRFFGSSDIYDPDRVSYDGELLRRFYLQNGYADFNLISTSSELSQDKMNFYITFTLDEGERYRVGRVKVDSRIKEVPSSTLAPLAITEEGDWYSSDDLEASIDAMKDKFAEMGYAFVEVAPQITRESSGENGGGELNITYLIEKARKVFVRKVTVQGNFHTLDKVIMRELLLREGDPFDINKVRRSRRNLEMLGIFQNAEIRTVNTNTPERVDLVVNVQEMPTGELALGTGYSSADGALGNIRLRERNFLGRGQEVSVGASVSQRQVTFDTGAVIPYLFERRLTGSGRLYHTKSDYERERSYKQSRIGARVGAGYELGRDLFHNVYYDFYINDLNYSRDEEALSRFQKEEQGSYTYSILTNALRYDTTNSYYNPTEGLSLMASLAWAGVGSEVNYLSLATVDTFYYTLVPRWTSSLTLRAGYIRGLGENVRSADHFYLGDRTFRGFQISGLGPREDTIAVGGTKYYVGQLEQRFPIGLPPELEIDGRAFFDIGTLYGYDLKEKVEKGSTIKDDKSLRYSTGIGVAWRSPFGGVRIYYAKVLKKEVYDRTESIIFSFGSSF